MNASWSRTALIAVNLPTKILLIATLAFTLLPMGAYGMESAEARKIKTEKYLKSKKVPFNKDLPLIEDAKSVKIRSAQDVARRAIVLYNITALGFGIEKQKVVETLKKSGVWDSMAPSEKEFVEAATPTKQQLIVQHGALRRSGPCFGPWGKWRVWIFPSRPAIRRGSMV